MRHRLVSLGILLLLLSGVLSAQEVTFKVYPSDAKIYRAAGTPDGRDFLGEPNKPINLGDKYQNSLLKVIVAADGRKAWQQSFTSGELPAGVYPERIYLHPENPLMYLVDLPQAFPIPFTIGFLLLGAGGFYYYREESAKRKTATRESALLALGKEYEKDCGDYTLIKDLGQGGMGMVRLGIRKGSTSAADLVAVKTVIFPTSQELTPEEQDTQSETTVARFRREAKILTDANHPNILKIYDWGVRDKEHYIVTEYLEGQDFREYMDDISILPTEEVYTFFSQVSSALQYLHGQGVYHRDLKPANIRRSPSGDAKIIDFGLATSPQQSKEITVQGAIQGTLLYMAPEHLQGQKQDELYDQFALGAILFEMLAGRPPIDELTDDNLGFMQVFTHYTAPRYPLSKFRTDLSEELTAVVDRMLQPAPSDRFPNIKEAFDAFEKAINANPDLLKR